MPLRLTSGTMQLRTGGYDEEGQPVSGTADIDLADASGERIWRLAYAAPLPGFGTSTGWLSVGAEHRRDPAWNGRRSDRRYSLALALRD